ncbi:MAG TPA: nucleoside/nucleotide kinase family protein [Candidatus Dormibacteraeota bacterium]|nr:nucleoside/nucleotide kinase family protein [Candidatus Dormibacteraeota bacterium]
MPGAGRAILGLAGAPGAGKSTLAAALVDAVCERRGPGVAALAPLDGFHLAAAQLRRLGRLDWKGAADTFDVWGYVALLGRLLAEVDVPVYAPDFDRALDEPVAARLVVPPPARLIVTEGNYLACPEPGWRDARALMAELWYVDAPDEVREARLLDRSRAAGRDEAAALDWVTRNDRANGELVKRTRGACDRVVMGC